MHHPSGIPQKIVNKVVAKVILVSDVLSGHAHGLHEATLATFYRIFGDVRPSAEVVGRLQEGHRALFHTTARNHQ